MEIDKMVFSHLPIMQRSETNVQSRLRISQSPPLVRTYEKEFSIEQNTSKLSLHEGSLSFRSFS